MATINLTKGGDAGYPAHLKGGSYRITRTVDFNANNEGGVSRPQAEVLQLINVPANSFVRRVGYIVKKPEGATLTFDIGDGADVDGYVDGANGNALGGGANLVALAEGAPNTVIGYSGGKYYSAADTIDLLINNAAAGAKITVVAIIEDLGADD